MSSTKMSENGDCPVDILSEDHVKVIRNEFQRLRDTVYLDHAGATLYSEVQMESILEDYKTNLYGNPHSKSTQSQLTEDAVDQIRYEILALFSASPEEYSIIFTSGATQSLKLVAETFRYNNGTFAYLCDNHTSVLGMREFASTIKPIKIREAYRIFATTTDETTKSTSAKNNLFVYPAQSNFSGDKYPLEWIQKMHNLNAISEGEWFSLLDAASYAATGKLDLSVDKPDFVPISFYKMFGYPTGLGALLVRNAASDVLEKKYFGGGTVLMAHSAKNVAIRRSKLHEKFEDGTISYLSVLALRHGLETLRRLQLTFDLISSHVYNLARYVYQRLNGLRHSNGETVATLYCNSRCKNSRQHGGVISFNLRRSNGEFVGFSEVLSVANLHNIQLRTGCFCNPGACQYHLGLSDDEIQYHFEQGHVCGDQKDLIDGTPTGSVRISFGYMSNKSDADKFLRMIETCFVDTQNNNRRLVQDELQVEKSESLRSSHKIEGVLTGIHVYPIKSCGAFSPTGWEITATGFRYDRKWMIVNASGVCVTQKKCPYMCLIKPRIDLERNVLELTFEGLTSIAIPLDSKGDRKLSPCHSKVCNDRIDGYDCGENVSNWLYEALNISGLRLIRQASEEDGEKGSVRSAKNDENQRLSLANQAQFLLINAKSAEWLMERLPESEIDSLEGLIKRFRPNLVVDLAEPFAENNLGALTIADTTLLNDGPCTRCQMICIDQETGDKSAELLLTLSKEFKGKMCFGVYLKLSDIINSNYLETGRVYIT